MALKRVELIMAERVAQIEQAVVEMKKDAKSAQDMSGKNFTITLDGKTYTDRTIAGQAVIDKRNSIVGKSENYIEKIGKFAGFDLYIRGDGSLILRGATDHTSRISISPLGTMTALTNTANGIDAEIESTEKAIARMRKAIPTLKEASIAPFEQADELEAKETELSELESDLAANPPKLIQADSRLDAMFGSSINYQSRAQQANADTQYQERDSGYWKPKLNNKEWALLNSRAEIEIRQKNNFLDQHTKWLYAVNNGTKVFAFYGIGDGSEVTILYASGGEKANSEIQKLKSYLEKRRHGINGSRGTFAGWIDAISDARRKYDVDNVSNANRRSTMGIDRILSEHAKRIGERDIERGEADSDAVVPASGARLS